jgi:hypothetical protein
LVREHPERGFASTAWLSPKPVTPDSGVRPVCMRKFLILTGSVVVSTVFGMLGARYGIMTGYMLGTVGGGIGMYAGHRLAVRFGA